MRRILLLLVIGAIGVSLGFSSQNNNEKEVSGDTLNVRDVRSAEPGKKRPQATENKEKKPKRKKKKTKIRNNRPGQNRPKRPRNDGPRIYISGATCRQTVATSTFCPTEMANALKLKNVQVFNFNKQIKRAGRHITLMGKKKGKKGNFAADAAILTSVVGGNLSEPACASTRSIGGERAADSAGDTGTTLSNCSSSIGEACADTSLNTTLTGACNDTMVAFAEKIATCESSVTDCTCWTAASDMKADIQKCDGKAEADRVKNAKTSCLSSFSACKKAQDSAVEFTATCPTSTGGMTTTSGPGRRIQYLAEMMARNVFRRAGKA